MAHDPPGVGDGHDDTKDDHEDNVDEDGGEDELYHRVILPFPDRQCPTSEADESLWC